MQKLQNILAKHSSERKRFKILRRLFCTDIYCFNIDNMDCDEVKNEDPNFAVQYGNTQDLAQDVYDTTMPFHRPV